MYQFTDKVHLSIVSNPFHPQEGLLRHFSDAGETLKDLVARHTGGDFEVPTVVSLNSQPILRDKWETTVLRPGDQVIFLPVVGDIVDIIIYIVILIVSVTVSLLLTPGQTSVPDNNVGETPAADPVFDIRGQKNQRKLGLPIESSYGLVRIWPSYASAPYNLYLDNESFLFQLFCIGHGEVEVHEINIEDTPIDSFNAVQYEIIPPGQPVTLFPDNVYTSTEVGGIRLYGPNESAYTDWSPPYVVCPPLSRTEKIEVDVVLPYGLYFQSSGVLVNRTVTATFQYRLIDDAGAAVGSWVDGVTFTKTMRTTTPQRFTLTITVPSGRYEVRGVRTNNAETDFKGRDELTWRALRAYLPSMTVYPGVTMLAVKAQASNNLNESASSRINLRVTRCLPVYDATNSVWLDPVSTRSPVWAFVDIFRASYGGRLTDEMLDLQSLAALAIELENDGIYFDWTFDQKSTTWEAAKVVSKICRGIPMLHGSRIRMAVERPQALPLAIFTDQVIAKDSFMYEIKLREPEDHDGLEAEFINPTTWQTETVLCLAPGDAGENTKLVKFPGCSDRTRAYRLGMYMRMCELKRRMNISFTTGLEGVIPGWGDLVLISHTMPRWGTQGYLLSVSGQDVTLSTNVEFTPDVDNYILLRKKNSDVFGPTICQPKYNAAGILVDNVVTVSDTLDLEDFYTGYGLGEPAIFSFGVATSYGKLATVAELTPQGDEAVAVKCLSYDPTVFNYDDATAPGLDSPFYIPRVPAVPVVKNLEVFAHPTSTTLIVLSWSAIAGVSQFVVERSDDGEIWYIDATVSTPYHVMTVQDQELWLRVSATNVGTGVAATWNGNVGIAIAAPSNIAGLVIGAWTGLSVTATWTAYTTGAPIDDYVVRVFMRPPGGGYRLARTERVDTNSYTYTAEKAVEDGFADRELKLLVTAANIVAESPTSASDTQTNAAPGMPTEPRLAHLGTEYVNGVLYRKWRVSWTGSGSEDLRFYRLWVASTNAFPVSSQYVVYEGTDTSYEILVPATLNPPYAPNSPARYWRVAELDVWGDEYTETAQQGIPAYNDDF